MCALISEANLGMKQVSWKEVSMNSPEIQTPDKDRAENQGAAKFKEGKEMRLAKGMNQARQWLSAGFSTITPWRVGRVLALSALLTADTALY
jgi:hypothetical protein